MALEIEELLTKTSLRSEELEIEGVGPVRVRGLSISELAEARGALGVSGEGADEAPSDQTGADYVRAWLKFALAAPGEDLDEETVGKVVRRLSIDAVRTIYQTANRLTLGRESDGDGSGDLENAVEDAEKK